MSFEQVIDIIASSFIFDAKQLLLDLSNLGVIAGGSVAYCLNGMGSINDVDVFLPLISEPSEYVEKIKELFWEHEATYSAYPNGGVFNVDIEKGNPIIQFIFSDLKTMEEICENFDLDYVVCGIHKGELYYPPNTKYIHEDKHIEVYPDPRNWTVTDRLYKSVAKGYKSYWFGYERSFPIPSTSRIDISTFVPTPFSSEDPYLKTQRRCMRNFEVIGIEAGDYPCFWDEVSGHWTPEPSGSKGFVECNFVVQSEAVILKFAKICMRMTVSHTKRISPTTHEVYVELANSSRYVFDFLVIRNRDLGEGTFLKLEVPANYIVSCYKTTEGKVVGVLRSGLEEGWVPLPMDVERIKNPSIDDLISYEPTEKIPFENVEEFVYSICLNLSRASRSQTLASMKHLMTEDQLRSVIKRLEFK
jgi:hypothetical protein